MNHLQLLKTSGQQQIAASSPATFCHLYFATWISTYSAHSYFSIMTLLYTVLLMDLFGSVSSLTSICQQELNSYVAQEFQKEGAAHIFLLCISTINFQLLQWQSSHGFTPLCICIGAAIPLSVLCAQLVEGEWRIFLISRITSAVLRTYSCWGSTALQSLSTCIWQC